MAVMVVDKAADIPCITIPKPPVSVTVETILEAPKSDMDRETMVPNTPVNMRTF